MTRAVAVFSSRTEAEIARARLESEGIESKVMTDSAGGWEPQLDAIRGVRLIVAEGDAELAAEILDVPEMAPEEPRPSVYPEWVLRSAMTLIGLMVLAGLFITVIRLI